MDAARIQPLEGSIMDVSNIGRRSLAKCMLAIGLGAMGFSLSGAAMAGCGLYGSPATAPPSWAVPQTAAGYFMPAVYRDGDARFTRVDFNTDMQSEGIVGLWKFKFISDGTAYPAYIPPGVVLDFGTVQWHSDGTEITFSAGRPPSSGDVCMGVWKKTGRNTYKLNHLALAWVSADTPPSQGGPVTPAAFVGPAVMHQVVTLDRSGNSFEGTFTIDQYAQDETTLLQHLGGKVVATRMTAD
jgi:hypothetical protein